LANAQWHRLLKNMSSSTKKPGIWAEYGSMIVGEKENAWHRADMAGECLSTAATDKPGLNESRLRYFVQMLWRESCVW